MSAGRGTVPPVAIVDEDVARVRASTDFVAVVSEHVTLKKNGRQWMGLCPFHPEKSPSFSVNGEEGVYYCFGCQAAGDAITFVREIDHLTFVEAVEKLAARANIQLTYTDDGRASQDRQRRNRLTEAMEKAVDWYHERLLKAPDAAPARGYLRSRGYDDVIGFFVAGVPRAVATCGTALTDEHVRLLKGFAPRLVLAYDADNAGQAAAERFYAWEQREKIDLAVAALPVGADPADVARKDPEALQDAVKQAKPFLAFRIERILGAADMRSPEGRARAAERAMEAIAEHPNELVRDQYIRAVADRCRVDAERLRAVGGRRGRATVEEAPRARARIDSPEIEALRLAVHAPAAMAE